MLTSKWICILYVGIILLIGFCIINKVEHFQVSLSDNKDLSTYDKGFVIKTNNTNNSNNTNNTNNTNNVYSLKNLSEFKETGVATNSGGVGNNSKTVLYINKDDGRNYNSMVQDLTVNYIDPNTEKNESCSPPGLCDIQEIKNKYTCGCGNNIGGCFKNNDKTNSVKNIVVSDNDIVEGYSNYSKTDLNGVFFTDYGGGEKYIPEGECGSGFQKNEYGLCNKLCHNCATYTTDHKDGLMKIKMDKEKHLGCDECSSCGGCPSCSSSCNCGSDNRCKSCSRCTSCNNCDNKKINRYLNFNDFVNY